MSRRSKYARRPRDGAYMRWVKSLPCAVSQYALGWHVPVERRTSCCGAVEADHMGTRGLGRKAPDCTCAPLCRQHHRERTDHSGMFRFACKAELRAWREMVMRETQQLRSQQIHETGAPW